MSVCTRKTVQLHRESVDNLHQVVDANVKVSYVEEMMESCIPNWHTK